MYNNYIIMTIEIRLKLTCEEEIKRIKELKNILNVKTNTKVIKILIKNGKL